MSTLLCTVLCIIGGAFVLCIGGLAAGLCLAASTPTPKPIPTKQQVEWWRAEAKIAHRRAS